MHVKDFIINQAIGNLYWKNKQGRYLGCNNAFARLLGLSSPNEIIGKTDRDLFLKTLGEEQLKAIIYLDHLIMTTGREKTVEETVHNPHGEVTYQITRKVPLYDKQKKIIGIAGTSIDITKTKLAEMVKKEFLDRMAREFIQLC
jgi:two-component system, OmpR family, aerobic respiration control sensor histidine kinase ArcB